MEGDILEVVSVKDEDTLGECWESPEEAMFFTNSLVSTKKALDIALLVLCLPPGHS